MSEASQINPERSCGTCQHIQRDGKDARFFLCGIVLLKAGAKMGVDETDGKDCPCWQPQHKGTEE